jgi:YVTN family beta-propeller protein
VIDLVAKTSTPVSLPYTSRQVEMSLDGGFAYVRAGDVDCGVWRIDVGAAALAGPRIPTGASGATGDMSLSHDGRTLVTCNNSSDDVSVIDTQTWTEVGRVPVAGSPWRAAFTDDDQLVVVSCLNGQKLSVLQNAGGSSHVLWDMLLGGMPGRLACRPGGAEVAVVFTASNRDSIAIVDLVGRSVRTAFPLPPGDAYVTADLRYEPAGTALWVTTGFSLWTFGPLLEIHFVEDGQLSVFDATTGVVLGIAETGRRPGPISISSGFCVMAVPSRGGLDIIEPCQLTAVPIPGGEQRDRSELKLSFPVPYRANTGGRIQVVLGDSGRLVAEIYDVRGRRISSLIDDWKRSGTVTIPWDGRDSNGRALASGIYFVRARMGEASAVNRMVLMR